jgi:hypothetical protein
MAVQSHSHHFQHLLSCSTTPPPAAAPSSAHNPSACKRARQHHTTTHISSSPTTWRTSCGSQAPLLSTQLQTTPQPQQPASSSTQPQTAPLHTIHKSCPTLQPHLCPDHRPDPPLPNTGRSYLAPPSSTTIHRPSVGLPLPEPQPHPSSRHPASRHPSRTQPSSSSEPSAVRCERGAPAAPIQQQ